MSKNKEINCLYCNNKNTKENMFPIFRRGNSNIKGYVCKDCYNFYKQDLLYKDKLEKYLIDKIGFPIITAHMHNQFNQLRESGLNNKQILYLMYYTYKIKQLYSEKFNYTISITFGYITQALKHAEDKGLDLITPDENYFEAYEDELIKYNKNRNDKINKLIKKQEEKNKLEQITDLKENKLDKIPINKISENQLEHYLINNLHLIENGMICISNQYEVPHGRIDILAKDKNGTLCIIELKIEEDDKRLIYQCAYYPTQFNEKVRMITIAPDYSKRIIDGLSSLEYVEKYKYDIELGTRKSPIKDLKISKY